MPPQKAIYDKVIVHRDEKGNADYIILHNVEKHTIITYKLVEFDMDEHLALANK